MRDTHTGSRSSTSGLRLHDRYRTDAERHEHRATGVPRSRPTLEHRRPASRRQCPAQRQASVFTRRQRCSHRHHHAGEYTVLNALGSPELADGKYLYSPASGRIEVQWIQGIGSERRTRRPGRWPPTAAFLAKSFPGDSSFSASLSYLGAVPKIRRSSRWGPTSPSPRRQTTEASCGLPDFCSRRRLAIEVNAQAPLRLRATTSSAQLSFSE